MWRTKLRSGEANKPPTPGGKRIVEVILQAYKPSLLNFIPRFLGYNNQCGAKSLKYGANDGVECRFSQSFDLQG